MDIETYHDLREGRLVEGPLGEHPKGMLIYSPDGHMAVNMMRTSGAPVQPGTHSYMGYAGTWCLDGDHAIHTILITPTTCWIGTDQTRDIELSADGNYLALYGTAIVNGEHVRRVLRWHRATQSA